MPIFKMSLKSRTVVTDSSSKLCSHGVGVYFKNCSLKPFDEVIGSQFFSLLEYHWICVMVKIDLLQLLNFCHYCNEIVIHFIPRRNTIIIEGM